MKNVKLLLLALSVFFCIPAFATDPNDELLSIITLSPHTITQSTVTSVLGTPARIEESKKKVLWFYRRGATNLVITWNKKSQVPDKVSFYTLSDGARAFDKSLSAKLVSGSTDLSEALKILGTPKDMTIKANKQEVYYSYQNKMLRLFFRENRLVDYCLY